MSVKSHSRMYSAPKNMAQLKLQTPKRTPALTSRLALIPSASYQFAIHGDPWLFHVDLFSSESPQIILFVLFFIESSKVLIYLFNIIQST